MGFLVCVNINFLAERFAKQHEKLFDSMLSISDAEAKVQQRHEVHQAGVSNRISVLTTSKGRFY